MRHREERKEPFFGSIRNADAPLTFEQAARIAGWYVPTFAGRDVSPESAMRIAAVYACVRLISGVISSLPFPVYTLKSDGERKPAEADSVAWLLNDEPCPGWSAVQFWKYMITAELLCGDQFAWIERDRNGLPVNLWPMDPRQTTVTRDKASGTLIYGTIDWRGNAAAYHGDDVLHVPGEGFDGLRGKSVIGWAARQGAGIALAAEEFAGRFFSNGARPDFALTTDKKVDAKKAAEILNYWIGRHQGVEASHVPALLTEGMTVKELQVSPEDSQLLETRKFQVIDIARAFGVPPILIGESEKTSAWGSGIEQIVLGFVKFSIKPMLDKISAEVNRKLLTSRIYRRRDRCAEHDLTDLERGDTTSQAAFARALVGGAQGPGIASVNEARQLFGLPKRQDGDSLYDPKSGGTPTAGNDSAPPPTSSK
jgi:HK97 family phage portal protein